MINKIISNWYSSKLNFFTILLLPMSFIFFSIVIVRKFLYHIGIKKIIKFKVPVIVVGNISIGGTGKTPLTIYLAKLFEKKGYKVGIVSRGYGAKTNHEIKIVTDHSDAAEVGDEPLLMFKNLNCKIAVSNDKCSAVSVLINEQKCNLILSDDGLQHYKMGRDVEIVVVDAMRQFGNSFCLPAGPLREPLSRLNSVDFIVCNSNQENVSCHFIPEYLSHKIHKMELIPDSLISVSHPNKKINLQDLKSKTVHAVAGIGNPDRFFQTLKNRGLNIIAHPFPDHYSFKFSDINFGESNIVIMTEKDAMKCLNFADERHWYLKISCRLDENFDNEIISKIYEILKSR